MLANDVSLRNLIPAELAQGLRLLPEQARHRVQPGRGHARRARRGLAGRPRAPRRSQSRLERRAGRPVRRRPGDDLPLRPADRAHRQDAQRARRQSIVGSGTVSNKDWDRGYSLHRREARDRDDPGRRAADRVHAATATRIRIEMKDARRRQPCSARSTRWCGRRAERRRRDGTALHRAAQGGRPLH